MLVSLATQPTVAIRSTPSEIYIKQLDRDPVVPVVRASATFALELILGLSWRTGFWYQ